MVPSRLHIEDEWRAALTEAGLGSFEAMMTSCRGRQVSWHTRGVTYRVELPDGRAVFLKRDVFTLTMLKDAVGDVLRLARPEPPCIKEAAALRRVRQLGIAAPEPIAWGQRRRFGLPVQAVLVMTELPGVALPAALEGDLSARSRLAAVRAVGHLARKLYEAGLSWPDLAPKHFLIADGSAGVIDLARMYQARRRPRSYMPQQVQRFCVKLRACGASDEEAAAFRAVVGLDELPAGEVPS